MFGNSMFVQTVGKLVAVAVATAQVFHFAQEQKSIVKCPVCSFPNHGSFLIVIFLLGLIVPLVPLRLVFWVKAMIIDNGMSIG